LSSSEQELASAIGDGLAALRIERLVLAIHDQSFPSAPDEDIGRGSPYGQAGHRLLRFLAGLGFSGVQLGPQGDTTLIDPSPYDGALLSKSPLSMALGSLAGDPAWAPLCQGLLTPMVDGRPPGPADRVRYGYAWSAARRALAELHQRFRRAAATAGDNAGAGAGHDDGGVPLAARFADFCRLRGPVLQADAEFEALTVEHGGDDWRRWPDLDQGSVDQWLHCPPPALAGAVERRRAQLQSTRAIDLERHLFGQFVLDQQHRELRRAAATAGPHGLKIYGDLQIGFSHRDIWSRRGLFRRDYLMGAPPSRTNPDGQPWGYPVVDPEQYLALGTPDDPPPSGAPTPGPAMRLLIARVDRMLADFDGIRVDHPHGLVCPWVYAADDLDPAGAVSRGARLLCSPNLPDHPRLAPLAIPSPEQLSHDPGIARYADDWVRELRDDQIARYGVLFDAIMDRVSAAGRHPADVVCEVLSTWPFPLRAVMQRHRLGRFCVTQKADLNRADDVYRSENAGERDWIMVGNHDTRPIWLVADSWQGGAAAANRAAYLAERLARTAPPALQARLARWLAADSRHLCHGLFAELFVSRARRVSIFFADLFGLREVYNRPGVVDPDNWTLRLPADFEDLYRGRLQRVAALNLPLALALALGAHKDGRPSPGAIETGRRLVRAALELTPSLDGEILAILEAVIGARPG
jgi:4-alpha-glucanotransferase